MSILIYETFAVGNEKYGRPTNPDYLLKSGELISLVSSQMHNRLRRMCLCVGRLRPFVQRITASKN